jgi:hypothetical protein
MASKVLGTKIFTRTLVPAKRAAAYIFNHVPTESAMSVSGRSHLKKARIGPTLMTWWPPHMRTLNPDFKEQEEQYWQAKQAYKRSRGDTIVKKGKGKKAMKAKSAASKNAAKKK